MKTVRADSHQSVVIFGATIAALGAVASYLVANIVDAPSDTVKSTLRQLSVYDAISAARPQFEAEVLRVRQQSASLPGLVPGKSAPLAAANIQSAVKLMVAGAGGEIRASQSLPATEASGFEQIQIAYDLSVPANRLGELIYQLETHTPYFFLDNVDIQAPQNVQPQAGDATSRIEVHWTVRGYRPTGDS